MRNQYHAAVANELRKNQVRNPMWTLLQVLLRLLELVRHRLYEYLAHLFKELMG